ncbi:MAG: DUF4979 domain-containing protein [Candidatus Cryptobacteroides sp.]
MKKSYMFIAATVVLAASCAKEQVPAVSSEPVFVAKTFSAEMTATKTSLDGAQVFWTEGDKISVFDNVANANNPFESSDIDGNGAFFTGYVADGATEYVAVYPYKYGTSYDAANRKITIEIPVRQKAVKGSFDNNLNVSLAVSEGDVLNFMNVCALLKVTIPEDMTNVRAVSLTSSTYLSGKTEITLSNDGTFSVAGNTSTNNAFKEVNLDNGGAAMEPGDYYFVVMPGTYTKIYLGVTTTDNELYTRYSNSSLTVNSNDVINLGDVPASGSKKFRLTNLPDGPISLLDTWTIGYETTSDYTGKEVTWSNRNGNIISSNPSKATLTADVLSGTGEVVFNKRPGVAMMYAVYDGVNYPVTFDVRPWYRDDPTSWTIATSGATYGDVQTSAEGEKYVEVTPNGEGRADIKRTSKPWVSPTMAPILAIRLDDYNKKVGCSCEITVDFASNFTFNGVNFTGSVDGGYNKARHEYECSDGSTVLVYDLTAQKVGSRSMPEDFLADGNIQIKMANVKKEGTIVQDTYRFFWFRTFGSLADLEEYLSDCTTATGLTYAKVK